MNTVTDCFRGASCLVVTGIVWALLVGCVADGGERMTEDLAEPGRGSIEDLAGVLPTWAVPVPEQEYLLGSDTTIDEYLVYAATHHPGLKAAYERWMAALARIPQAQSLADPRLSYRYFIENVETRVGPQRQALGISQTFPWFGELEIRGGAAASAARAARSRYEHEREVLFYQVKRAYHEYSFLARSISVVRENRKLVEYIEEVARTRFKTAAGSHPDVIRAQVELGRLDDRLRTLEDLRLPLRAGFNMLLNRPSDAELPWPMLQVVEPVTLDSQELVGRLRRNNAELMALWHEVSERRERIGLAQKGYYPDVTIGVDYIDTDEALGAGVVGSGDDAISIGVSFTLPIWREKYDAGVREALAQFGASTRERMDRRNQLEADLQMVLYHFRDADRKIDLYRDTLVPKAKQSIKAAESAFRAGTAGFIDLIDAERVLLEFQLAIARAEADRSNRLAEIEMLVGGPVGSVSAGPQTPRDQADSANIEIKDLR